VLINYRKEVDERVDTIDSVFNASFPSATLVHVVELVKWSHRELLVAIDSQYICHSFEAYNRRHDS
jgi:hypothetical protein